MSSKLENFSSSDEILAVNAPGHLSLTVDLNFGEDPLKAIELDHLRATEKKSGLDSLHAVTAQRDTLCRELSRMKEELHNISEAKRRSDLLLIAAQHEQEEFRKRDTVIARENLKVLQVARNSAVSFEQENSELKSQIVSLKFEKQKLLEQIDKLNQQNSLLSHNLASATGY